MDEIGCWAFFIGRNVQPPSCIISVSKSRLSTRLHPFCLPPSCDQSPTRNVIKIQGYYKRNRHFQCCTDTKLLMIEPKYLHGFVVHVFKFKNDWKKMFIFPLRYYANCVSTTLTVLILHNVESVYFFHSNPVYSHIRCRWTGRQKITHDYTFFMEAIPMCQLGTIKNNKFSNTSILFIIKVTTCFDPTGSSSGLHSEPTF